MQTLSPSIIELLTQRQIMTKGQYTRTLKTCGVDTVIKNKIMFNKECYWSNISLDASRLIIDLVGGLVAIYVPRNVLSLGNRDLDLVVCDTHMLTLPEFLDAANQELSTTKIEALTQDIVQLNNVRDALQLSVNIAQHEVSCLRLDLAELKLADKVMTKRNAHLVIDVKRITDENVLLREQLAAKNDEMRDLRAYVECSADARVVNLLTLWEKCRSLTVENAALTTKFERLIIDHAVAK